MRWRRMENMKDTKKNRIRKGNNCYTIKNIKKKLDKSIIFFSIKAELVESTVSVVIVKNFKSR
jgi:hypothetical protein